MGRKDGEAVFHNRWKGTMRSRWRGALEYDTSASLSTLWGHTFSHSEPTFFLRMSFSLRSRFYLHPYFYTSLLCSRVVSKVFGKVLPGCLLDSTLGSGGN